MKWTSAVSEHRFLKYAVAECAVEIKEALGDQSPDLLVVFVSAHHAARYDELPEVINIWKGDMSLVGPRPERPVLIEEFKSRIPNYMLRHKVKAGITGWAQVNGWRGNTSLEKRIEHDLYYIERWSIWFDLKILLLTLFRGFVNPNAY